MSNLEQLYQLKDKNSLVVAGVLSGTSADGIDVAMVRFGGPVDSLNCADLLASKTYPYSKDTAQLLALLPNLTVEQVSVLNYLVAKDFADAINKLSIDSKVDFDLVGSHGQTIFHHSSAPSGLSKSHPSTLQVGNGAVLATILKKPVVYDFRANDIANGGQGAPLTPATDYYLYRNMKDSNGNKIDAILNLGGIGNLTVFSDSIEKILGFDTGPANAPIDRLVRIYTSGKQNYDVNGKLGFSGVVNQELIKKLLNNDTFVKKNPPKSSGFEAYGDQFVQFLIQEHGKPVDQNLIATATSYVAHTVAYSVKNYINTTVKNIVVAGGGARNDFLMKELQSLLPSMQIVTSDAVGISGDFREATAFALLGYANIKGFKFNLSSITGSCRPSILGCIAL
jgi:anhydro-N-acetylmuramic acid kinase